MRSVLIANRGEIAVRIARSAADAGLRSIAIFADPDADAPHVRLADAAYALEGTSGADTYLNAEKILSIARRAGADAVHPGYGFLSENADFAQAVIDAGLVWVGPGPETIRTLGNKVAARDLAASVDAPLVPGSDGPVPDAEAARAFAEEHGLPIIIKAAAGGGGRGMRVVTDLAEVATAFDAARREAEAAFGDGECFVERFLERPRHVEAQVLADAHGTVLVVGLRDCSLQRRNQKLVEEAPAPLLTAAQESELRESARRICSAADYRSAGTVEFLLGADGTLSFLEVNTRLQVEHPVTEETTGVDLVAEQFRVAAGEPLSLSDDPVPCGHAFEFRINAEDPALGFLPSPGPVDAFDLPSGPGVRVDAGVTRGGQVPAAYDSMLAKLVVWGPDRATALARARRALDEMHIEGLATVLPFHRAVVREPAFAEDFAVYTSWIESEFDADLSASEFLGTSGREAGRRRVRIEIDGRSHVLGLPETLLAAGQAASPAADAAESEAASGVTASAGGTFVTWLVEDGAEVAEGDGVAVLEAMKMETTVRAPRAGTVALASLNPGDRVAKGDSLAELR